CRMALIVPLESAMVAALDADNINRTAPARICKIPACCVIRRSPTNTVVPTVAVAVPTFALDAEVIMPTAGADAPRVAETRKRSESAMQKAARTRAIGPPHWAKKSIPLAGITSIRNPARRRKFDMPTNHPDAVPAFFGPLWKPPPPPVRMQQLAIFMADWKQITARIRRAKGSKDPAGQLSNLFQKTRDAMVAFELARHLETASKSEEAVKWYAISWQRFRRGDWKTKAQDAVTR